MSAAWVGAVLALSWDDWPSVERELRRSLLQDVRAVAGAVAETEYEVLSDRDRFGFQIVTAAIAPPALLALLLSLLWGRRAPCDESEGDAQSLVPR